MFSTSHFKEPTYLIRLNILSFNFYAWGIPTYGHHEVIWTDKVCLLDLEYSPDVCYNLTHKKQVPKEMSDAVQSKVAELAVYDGVLGTFGHLIESYLLVQTNKVMELFSRKKIWRLVSLHNGQTNFGIVHRVLSLLFWYLTLQHSLPLGSIRVFISFF